MAVSGTDMIADADLARRKPIATIGA